MVYRLEQTVGFSIYRVAMRLRHELTQRLTEYDLTSEQFAILARLWEEDGMCQRALAERILKDRPNVTRMLDKLQAKGLVVRRPDLDDRRAFHVCLTESGRALEKTLLPVVERLRRTAYQGISENQQQQLKRLLNKVFDNLENNAH